MLQTDDLNRLKVELALDPNSELKKELLEQIEEAAKKKKVASFLRKSLKEYERLKKEVDDIVSCLQRYHDGYAVSDVSADLPDVSSYAAQQKDISSSLGEWPGMKYKGGLNPVNEELDLKAYLTTSVLSAL